MATINTLDGFEYDYAINATTPLYIVRGLNVAKTDYMPPAPAHSFTKTLSPTFTTPLPRGTPLHPKQGLFVRVGSFPALNFMSTLYGTAASRTPVLVSTFGSCIAHALGTSVIVQDLKRTKQRVHLDTRLKVRSAGAWARSTSG